MPYICLCIFPQVNGFSSRPSSTLILQDTLGIKQFLPPVDIHCTSPLRSNLRKRPPIHFQGDGLNTPRRKLLPITFLDTLLESGGLRNGCSDSLLY